jgi:hypothetical protein
MSNVFDNILRRDFGKVLERGHWLKWVILFGFSTLFSFLYANQIYFEMRHNQLMLTPGGGSPFGSSLSGGHNADGGARHGV